MSRRRCTCRAVALRHLLALVISTACWSVTGLAQAQPL
jgi:hypothetical protein